MQDMKLSEVREICQKRHKEKGDKACEKCQAKELCGNLWEEPPMDWDFIEEQREMIGRKYTNEEIEKAIEDIQKEGKPITEPNLHIAIESNRTHEEKGKQSRNKRGENQ